MSTTTSSKKTFTLYTAKTSNGIQISILLEELKTINQSIDYDVFKFDFSSNANLLKEPWFKKLSPNAAIPVLVDHARGDFVIFETGAILLYLAQHYDLGHALWFDPQREASEYSTMLQWIFFGHGGVGPMQSQAFYMRNTVAENITYAQKRFLEETKRLYSVVEIRLENRDWLAGPGRGKYSLADIKIFPWLMRHHIAGIENLDEWPRIKAWIKRNCARDGVIAGLEVPE